ncbi:ABC transporter substrate-binding protein [Enterovirga rhinocerotis]|uniref:ABC transporter substrate-binding protein n=1 Tax=Enterovirga rhinocerotis TaxID=1339210 RepID=UPI00315DB133
MFGLAVALAIAGSAVAQAQVKVKIGVLNDQSGIGAALGGRGSVVAAQLAAEDYQKANPGAVVEVVTADHQNKPDIGAAIARRWFDQEGVQAIFDVQTSSVALAVHDLARQGNKVLIASGAGTADLTGARCTPNTVHWTYDTWALGNALGRATVRAGGKSWFFITADYSFGHALQRDTSAAVKREGGTVVGQVLHPFATTDYSSLILQAQGSKAQVVGLATSAGDLVNIIKQSAEFGVTQSGQQVAALLMFISDVHALGLEVTQGMTLVSPFYWDQNPETRAWSERVAAKNGGQMPTMVHAGVYAGLQHYLKALETMPEAKRTDGAASVQAMKTLPTEDILFGKGSIRSDGRKLHDMHLFQIKKPSESKGPYDYYKRLSTVSGQDAFRPLSEGGCTLAAN